MRGQLDDLLEFHVRGKEPARLGPNAQLGVAECLARRAGLHKAASIIAAQQKRYPSHDWPHGACAWCETEGKRRKATMLDIGSGTPECDRHAAEAGR